jgi:DNA-binding MarR family transcriptional regulator
MSREMEELYSELFDAAGLGRRVGEEIAALEGQTQARWQTMWTIDAGGLLTVPQVARRLGVSRQNVQRVTNELVTDGLAELVANPDHKTSPLLRLTPEGSRVLTAINRAAEASHQGILATFPAPKVEQLRSLLHDFRNAAQAQHPDL